MSMTRYLQLKTGFCMRRTEISTRAVRETVRKVWSSFPQPASKFVPYLREMKGEVNNSNLTENRI